MVKKRKNKYAFAWDLVPKHPSPKPLVVGYSVHSPLRDGAVYAREAMGDDTTMRLLSHKIID